jgi:site-specific DNA-methyltransferase (adenine-specific)
VGESVDILGGSVGRIVLADNLAVLVSLPDDSIDLVYIDPPFNTGKRQTLRRLRTVRDEKAGDRTGFGGRRYRTIQLGSTSYLDVHDDYLDFLEPRLVEIRRVLRPTGSLYLHLDPREAHYAKVLCDAVFGRDCFLNEVIWAYDYGARTRRRWPAKHDDILVYVKDAGRYWFDAEAVERIPYMAPGLVGPEKAARGKLPTDTVLRRVVSASCPVGGVVADFFAGSGTTGAAALELGRRFLLVDSNPEAVAVMARRLGGAPGVEVVGE